jgi:uncharacterized RDD family membrane protein YckC
MRAVVNMTDTHDYKVTGSRIVAALLDLIPLVVLFFIMAAALGEFGSTEDDGFSVSLTGWPAALWFFLCWGYFVILEGLIATTPGKFLMGLKVVKLNDERYDWRAVLLRNIIRIVDGAPILYIVGLISIAVTEKNQRLGDLAAGTVVVRKS